MKRNFVFYAWILLCACFLCCYIPSAYAFDPSTDLDPAIKWKEFAGTPEHQEIEADSLTALGQLGGNLCPKYSSLQCLEILYNAWYGLGANKLDLDIRYYQTGMIEDVLGRLKFDSPSSSAWAKQNVNTFPNYDHAFFRINSWERLWDGWVPYGTPDLTSLQSRLNETPVIIRIKNYAVTIASTVQSTSYNGSIVTIPSTGDGFHYVVVVNYGTENGTPFLECMNSYGHANGNGTYSQNGYGDFFRVSTANFNDWCEAAYCPYIHTQQRGLTSNYLAMNCAAKIFPNLLPSIADYFDKDHLEAGEAFYICGNATISSSVYSATIPGGRTMYVVTDSGGSTNSITVPAGKTLTLGDTSGLTITRLGNSGYWSGITVNGKVTFKPGSVVEYAKTGITNYADGSGGIEVYPTNSPYGTIQHCRDFGIYSYNCSPTISYLKITENYDVSYPYSTGIRVAGSSSNPTVYRVAFNKSRTELSLDSYTDAILKNSNLGNSTNVVDNIYVGAYAYLNLGYFYYDPQGGYNKIYPGTGYTINNPSYYYLPAALNYWSSTPNFYQADLIQYSDSTIGEGYDNGSPPLSKPAGLSPDLFASAQGKEAAGDWNGAIGAYKEILAENTDPVMRRAAVKSILHDSEMRCQENKVVDYREARSVILSELMTATSSYRAVLDYLLCEVLVKEGKYTEAIDAFTAKAAQYAGTSMEVEMLTRVAVLYGMNLKDKVKAKEIADKAATLNPGQECLYIAYRTAGMDYLPWQYTDRFKGVTENFDRNPEQPKPAAESESVSVSPNPANPMTTITYSIKAPSSVKLYIYSINGQKVATLVDSQVSAGRHSVKFDGSKFASGVYFYRFESAGMNRTGKMLLLK